MKIKTYIDVKQKEGGKLIFRPKINLYINSEIERLKSEIEHIDKQLNRLFELRMSEEINKKEYQTRKADYNLQKSRLQTQLEVKYRGDDGFTATVLNTLKILSKAKDIFTATTRSIIDKQLLLHLLFKQIILQEGIISCILNQPFSFILSYDVLKATGNDTATKTESCEPSENKGLQGNFGGNFDFLKNTLCEP